MGWFWEQLHMLSFSGQGGSHRERSRLAPFFLASQCACELNGTASYSYENSEERTIWTERLVFYMDCRQRPGAPYGYSAVCISSQLNVPFRVPSPSLIAGSQATQSYVSWLSNHN
jgi:hypothetical protein